MDELCSSGVYGTRYGYCASLYAFVHFVHSTNGRSVGANDGVSVVTGGDTKRMDVWVVTRPDRVVGILLGVKVTGRFMMNIAGVLLLLRFSLLPF